MRHISGTQHDQSPWLLEAIIVHSPPRDARPVHQMCEIHTWYPWRVDYSLGMEPVQVPWASAALGVTAGYNKAMKKRD
jgi:hypothetical protein